MNEKCPVCGAPMNGVKCEYCDHILADTNQPAVQKDTYYQPPQPQVVVINQTPQQTTLLVSKKNRWVVFALALFLGAFGIHRFYVGKVGTGIIWLFTLGLFGIGWFVDIIMTLCGKFKDKQGLILK